jgi:MarR family
MILWQQSENTSWHRNCREGWTQLLPQSTLLRIVRNLANPDNRLISDAIAELKVRLPSTWRTEVELESARSHRVFDALLRLCAPDGTCGAFILEAKNRLEPREVQGIADQLGMYGRLPDEEEAVPVLVAPFLSSRTRERLEELGVGYVDLTGNVRVAADRPALFVRTTGAEHDPRREERPARTLKGAKAGRVVRALCDFAPPVGVRELAGRAGIDPGYASRVLALLEKEDLIRRERRGPVTDVDWRDLLRRWTEDYSLFGSNRTATFLEPRGINSLLRKLQDSDLRYAATGSLGPASVAPVAPARLAVLFVDDAEDAAWLLGLRPAEAGTNVILAEPFDPVVYERCREHEEVSYVAFSQNAADLLTSPGRGPSEAEELMDWMEENEDAWRERAS